jgi:hypothetical protein
LQPLSRVCHYDGKLSPGRRHSKTFDHVRWFESRRQRQGLPNTSSHSPRFAYRTYHERSFSRLRSLPICLPRSRARSVQSGVTLSKEVTRIQYLKREDSKTNNSTEVLYTIQYSFSCDSHVSRVPSTSVPSSDIFFGISIYHPAHVHSLTRAPVPP